MLKLWSGNIRAEVSPGSGSAGDDDLHVVGRRPARWSLRVEFAASTPSHAGGAAAVGDRLGLEQETDFIRSLTNPFTVLGMAVVLVACIFRTSVLMVQSIQWG